MRCILHIGTPKTGSTELQRWLVGNAKTLSEHRVALSRTLGPANNRLLPSMFTARDDTIHVREGVASGADRLRFEAALSARFDSELDALRADHDVMVLTGEHLYRDVTGDTAVSRLAAWLRERFEDVRVVCYVREQADLHRSRYSNLLRSGIARDAPMPEPNPNFLATYDYLARLAPWERAFGRDAMTVRLYDRDRLAEGDVRADFLAAVLAPAVPGIESAGLAFGDGRTMRALTRRQAVLSRAVNRCFPLSRREPPDRTAQRLKEGLANLPFLRGGPPEAYPGAAALHDRLHAANVRFAEHWFGAARNPFRRPAPPEPETDMHYREAEVVEIVEAICGTDGLTVLAPGERVALHAIAARLMDGGLVDDGTVRAEHVVTLLAIALRCDPDDAEAEGRMETMRRKLFERRYPPA